MDAQALINVPSTETRAARPPGAPGSRITLCDMSEVSSRSRCTASDPGLAVDLRREGLGAIAALMVPARPEVA